MATETLKIEGKRSLCLRGHLAARLDVYALANWHYDCVAQQRLLALSQLQLFFFHFLYVLLLRQGPADSNSCSSVCSSVCSNLSRGWRRV